MTNLRTLDLNLLKAFDALMDERSVTRAADRLSLTQPAVSGMLIRLRESFDDQLFVRSRHGVVPTLRALELADQVKKILREVEAMLQPTHFEPGSADMKLSIAATDYALKTIVVPFLKVLRTEAPGIRVSLLPLKDDHVSSQLERGDLDLALMSTDAAPADLYTCELFEESYVCAMREGHPDAGKALSLDRFCQLDHALGSYVGGNFKGDTDAALEKLGRERRVVVSAPNFLILPEILRASDLIAVVPRRLLTDSQGLVLVEPPLDIKGFTRVMVWHQRSHSNPAHRWLRELIATTCKNRT